MICQQNLCTKSDQAKYSHYRTHKVKPSMNHSIRDIHLKFSPQYFPSFDFNNDFGSWFSRQSVVSLSGSEALSEYWRTYFQNPTLHSYPARDIRDHYRDAFYAFLKVHPISLHGHASDAANPFMITSLIKHFQNFVLDYDTND